MKRTTTILLAMVLSTTAHAAPFAAPAATPSVGAPAPAPRAQPAHAAPDAIDIVSATFGREEFRQTCDVRKKIAALCQGKSRCTVSAKPELCLPDQPPAVLIPKLSVHYRCATGGKVRLRQADKPFTTHIACG